MAEIPPPGERPLSEVERQAFQRLSLTEGHWAALAPAPLFYRSGLRAPNRRYATDLDMTERLRLELRTAPGLSGEAGHFWERLGDGSRRNEATLATRLLAWHLATNLSFVQRVGYFQLLKQAAEHFLTRNTHPPRTHEAVQYMRWLVDSYLPYPTFLPNGDPPYVTLSPPDAGTLDALADVIQSPQATSWPMTSPAEAHRVLPTLVHVMGEPVRDWWGRRDPARRAAERGLASFPFEDRQRVFSAVYGEWQRALQSSYPSWPNTDEFAQRLVMRMREWVDAVRWASRGQTAPRPAPAPAAEPAPAPAEGDPARALLSTPTARTEPPLHPEYVRIPAAVREPLPVAKPVAPKNPAKPKPERVTAAVAESFAMVRFDEALERARAVSVTDVCAWIDCSVALLFDDCRDESSREVAVVRTENAVPNPLWVIGDVHADLLTLANIIAYAEAQSTPEQPAHYLFLGDFVDRGIHDHETLLLLFQLMMDHPERVCIVPGNHDIDLRFDEATNRFRVTIEPAEYCETLNVALQNDTPEDRDRVALAKAFIRFCAARPKAVFLPDGTLLTHGGFPHTDAQKDIAALTDLCKSRCLDDFLWARIAESARVKRPNRGSRGHEFGWDTLLQFSKLVSEKLDVPVKRLVRGHDHVTDRWMEYPEYADNGVPVLTINAMGRLLDGEPARRDGRVHPLPVVARCATNRLPDVFMLPLDPAEVDRAFKRTRPKPAESEPASAPTGEPRAPDADRSEPGAGAPS